MYLVQLLYGLYNMVTTLHFMWSQSYGVTCSAFHYVRITLDNIMFNGLLHGYQTLPLE